MEVKGGLLALKALLSGERRVRVVVALGILGMLLVLASQCASAPKKEASAGDGGLISNEAYTEAMEKKLGGLVGQIEGVGKARVMITLESSAQMVYAVEEKMQTERVQDVTGEEKRKEQSSDNSQQSYVLIDRGSGQKQPLLEARLEPQVKGVVVVCPGADSKIVVSHIVDVVTTALGIGANKVCVVKGGT